MVTQRIFICLNDVLKTELEKNYNPKPGKNPLDCIKSVDPTTLPPCSKVLLQEIKRACYVAYLSCFSLIFC